ncbi:MAG: hypothetical protein R3C11_24970 [Planctomycetaceae bacterium]
MHYQLKYARRPMCLLLSALLVVCHSTSRLIGNDENKTKVDTSKIERLIELSSNREQILSTYSVDYTDEIEHLTAPRKMKKADEARLYEFLSKRARENGFTIPAYTPSDLSKMVDTVSLSRYKYSRDQAGNMEMYFADGDLAATSTWTKRIFFNGDYWTTHILSISSPDKASVSLDNDLQSRIWLDVIGYHVPDEISGREKDPKLLSELLTECLNANSVLAIGSANESGIDEVDIIDLYISNGVTSSRVELALNISQAGRPPLHECFMARKNRALLTTSGASHRGLSINSTGKITGSSETNSGFLIRLRFQQSKKNQLRLPVMIIRTYFFETTRETSSRTNKGGPR